MASVDKQHKSSHGHDEAGKGGLPQEESGGPGSAEKRHNQERDGQREQGRQNDDDHQGQKKR